MSQKNPTKEIFYFKHLQKPLAYILMSLKIDREEFNELFPETNEISESELDELVELKNYKVVMVGDDKIIDEHFKD